MRLIRQSFLLLIPIILLVSIADGTIGQFNSFIQEVDSIFSGPIAKGTISNKSLDEISGMAVSTSNPKYIWAHNDSGDDPRIYLMDKSGKHKGVFYFKNAFFRDVEDMAIGKGPLDDRDYLYLADIGDNLAVHDYNYIFRVEEPYLTHVEQPVFLEIKDYEKITYVYPDGQRDAEAIVVDPNSKDIYIFSKREPRIHLYKLPYPQSTKDTLTAELVGKLNMSMVVAADMAANGRDLLVKTYRNVFYYEIPENASLEAILEMKPKNLPYVREPQGEAIAWDKDAIGYFTASEEMKIFDAVLYYYERIMPALLEKDINE